MAESLSEIANRATGVSGHVQNTGDRYVINNMNALYLSADQVAKRSGVPNDLTTYTRLA
jgi:hypothetical protein